MSRRTVEKRTAELQNEIHDATLLPMLKLRALACLLSQVNIQTGIEDETLHGLSYILDDIYYELDDAGGGEA